MILKNCFISTSLASTTFHPTQLIEQIKKILSLSFQFLSTSKLNRESNLLYSLRNCVLQELISDSSLNLVVSILSHLKPLISFSSTTNSNNRSSSSISQQYHLLIQSRGMMKEKSQQIQYSQFLTFSKTILEISLWGQTDINSINITKKCINYKLFIECLIEISSITSKEYIFNLLSYFIESSNNSQNNNNYNTLLFQILFLSFNSTGIDENSLKYQKVCHILIEWVSTR